MAKHLPYSIRVFTERYISLTLLFVKKNNFRKSCKKTSNLTKRELYLTRFLHLTKIQPLFNPFS